MSVVISKANKILVVPKTPAIDNFFTNAIQLDGQRVLIPHELRETLLLRHLGHRIPAPVLSYYDWRGGTPFEVQRQTCALLTTSPRAYVLNDLGTGKTKAALWSWDYLHGNKNAGKLLIVCPISTMNFVWAHEILATIPHRKCIVLYGSKSERLKRLNEEADIYIINHDGVRVIEKELSTRTDIDTLVLDELAVYRNNSDRSKLMRKFAARFQWVWGMTGKPMPNEPTDVWSQCRIITPNSVPKYFRLARDLLMVPVNKFKWAPKPDATETAFKMMQPSVRYNLDDVTELPDVVYRTLDVDLSTEQLRAYSKLVKEFKVLVDQKTITAVNAGAALNKLLQVACGWVYTTNPEFVCLKPDPRVNTLLDLIADADHKVLVFVPYRHAVDGLSQILSDPHNAVEHLVIHGDTPQAERDQKFNIFQNTSKFKVLLAHPQCLAHGITLTSAATVIWYSPTTSLDIYDQANARIRRVGQKNRQQIIHLQGSLAERKIYTLLRAKQKIQDTLLSLFESATNAKLN